MVDGCAVMLKSCPTLRRVPLRDVGESLSVMGRRWWPRPDSNRHSGFPEADFKSAVSTVPPRGPRVGAHPDRAQWDALHQLLSGACSCRRTGTHFAGTCAAVLALAARVLEADKLRVPPVRHAAPHPGHRRSILQGVAPDLFPVLAG